jgi:hypothetical protein
MRSARRCGLAGGLESGLNGKHGDRRSSQRQRYMPDLRRLLFLFIRMASFYDRGRRGTRPDPASVRQRQLVRNALQWRPLRSPVRPNRDRRFMRDLYVATGGLPQLHARGCRMRNGAQAAWLAGAHGPQTEPVTKLAACRWSAGTSVTRLPRPIRHRARHPTARTWKAAWSRA